MATCRDIVTRAMRRGRITDLRDQMSGDELSHGMIILQECIDTLRGGIMPKPVSIVLSDDATVTPNSRNIILSSLNVIATLPTRQICDDKKPMRDGALVEVLDEDSPMRGFYRFCADEARWIQINQLNVDSLFPLGSKNEGGFIAHMAERLREENGYDPLPVLSRDADQWRSLFGSRFGEREDVQAEYL